MSHLRNAVFVALALNVSCRDDQLKTNLPNVEATPKALSFEACPTLDETGKPVADVYPDEKKLSLSNTSRAGATLAYSITGADKDAFSLVESSKLTDLESLGKGDLPIRFSPSKKGDSKAELVIDDGTNDTPLLSIPLIGTGRNLPSQPTLEVAVENKDAKGKFDVCPEGTSCLMFFPNTFYKQASTINVKIKNKGCPTLKVTALELVPLSDTPGNLAYFIDQPNVLPTSATPISLTTADGNDETTVQVRFSPEDDNSGNESRFAFLKIFTNDPATPQLDIQLFGTAARPDVYSYPTFCDFSLGSDTCGYATKQPNKARFEVKNGGTVNIVISEVSMSKGGQGRFTITKNVVGKEIAPGASETLEISHADAPVYVTELVTIKATANGMDAGQAFLSIAGGVKPCLSTDPEDQLDFKNATSELTTKTVTIKNGPGCGTLVIDNVFTDASSFFSVVEPKIPLGQVVQANGSAIATIQYKKPVSGGVQAGVLRIITNDPDYGGSAYKVVRLYSDSPLDQLPVAVLQGCKSDGSACTEGTLNVSLSSMAQKEIQLDATKSFDPPGTAMPAGSKYLYRLVTKPSNSSGSSLAKDGQKVTDTSTRLTLDAVATGLYRVTLTVFDDQNQASPAASELKIFVTQ